MFKKAIKRNQKGGALPFAALLPFAAKALPFLGKAALGGAASFGSSKILGSIFGGGRKRPYIKKKKLYLGGKKTPYIANSRLYLGGRKKRRRSKRRKRQRGGFLFPNPASFIAKKLIKKLIK